jgi:hypothetical protein
MNIKEEVQGILEANDLDFNISKIPFVYSEHPNDNTKFFGLRNDKTGETLNTVKEGYSVTQNSQIVEAVVRGVDGYGDKLKVYNAGSLHGGRRVYIQLEVEGIAQVGKDSVKKYITIIDSNDGSTGLSVGIGTKTMSCSNQFFQFYRSGVLKMRHTTSLDIKVKELPQLIQLALESGTDLIKKFQEWESTPIKEGMVDDLVNHLIGIDRRSTKLEVEGVSAKRRRAMDVLYGHIKTEVEDKGANLWGLHSGVTYWTTHSKQHPRRLNGHMESLMTGTNYKTADAAMEFINNY